MGLLVGAYEILMCETHGYTPTSTHARSPWHTTQMQAKQISNQREHCSTYLLLGMHHPLKKHSPTPSADGLY